MNEGASPRPALATVETFLRRSRLHLLQAMDAASKKGRALAGEEDLALADGAVQDFLLHSLLARTARERGLAETLLPDPRPPRATSSALAAVGDELGRLPLSALEPADLGTLHEMNLARCAVRDFSGDLALRARAGARRRRGSYYTPRTVARAMLRRTLGRRLQDERVAGEPAAIFDLRLLDPACGAGLFLSEAFDLLLAYYDRCGMREEGARRILANHLHGIDLDARAVAAARAILTLQAAVAVPGDTLRVDDALTWAVTEAGDEGEEAPTPSPESEHAVGHGRPADRRHAMVRHQGAFDFVVGNPPYIANRDLDPAVKASLAQRYRTLAPGYDLAVPFLEAGLRLLRPGGELAYLVTNKFLAAEYGLPIRRMILDKYRLREVEDLSRLPLFRGAASYPVVVIVGRSENEDRATPPAMLLGEAGRMEAISPEVARLLPGRIITTRLRPAASSILRKTFERGIPLPEAIIHCGIARSGFARRAINGATWRSLPAKERARHRPLLVSADVWPFRAGGGPRRYIEESVAGPTLARLMTGRKLLVAGAGLRLRAAVEAGDAALGRVYFLREARAGEDLDYLCGLFNSRLLNWLYALLFWPAHMAGGYLRINAPYLARLPLARRALLSGRERSAAETLSTLAASMRGEAVPAGDPRWEEIDVLVERIYGLDQREGRVLASDLTSWLQKTT